MHAGGKPCVDKIDFTLGAIMKTVLMLLSLFPCLALAAGYGGADGVNKRGEHIHLGDDAGDGVDTIYVYESTKSYRDRKLKVRFALYDECSFDSDKIFSCKANGKSPLAGATYKVTTSKKYRPCKDETLGEVYVCVAGCDNNRVPKIFHVSPWECVP